MSVLLGLLHVRIIMRGIALPFEVNFLPIGYSFNLMRNLAERPNGGGLRMMTARVLRLVRHKTSGAYLGKDGSWVQDFGSARRFEDIHTILSVQQQLDLTEIEIILQMGPEPCPEYDIAFPLANPRDEKSLNPNHVRPAS